MQELPKTLQSVNDHAANTNPVNQSSNQYHRMAVAHPRHPESPTKRLHPIRGIIVGLILAFLVQVIVFGAATLGGGIAGLDVKEVFLSDDPLNPTSKAIFLLSLSAVVPVVFIAARVAGYRSRFLISIAGRIRWDIFAVAAAVSIVVNLFFQTIAFVSDSDIHTRHLGSNELWVILAVLLLVPLQAVAEELFARGFLPQVFGYWLKNPWLAYLPGGTLWIFLHGYNAWGLASIAYSALIYGVLVHKTGGLEASSAIHIVGNYLAFIQPVIIVSTGSNAISWEAFVADMVVTTLAVALSYFFIRRFGLIPRDENHRV